jgi:hypothetical protein
MQMKNYLLPLKALKTPPVLVDVGASDSPPKIWDTISSQAIYLGFDPDRRELPDIPHDRYLRSIIIDKALTAFSDQRSVNFYLTRSPYCSSILLPDQASLSNYLLSDLFVVEKEVSVPATTLTALLEDLSLPGVDWFKTDSQGTDLRLFQSLPDQLRSQVLAVDVEPGLIDAYQGEDLFVDTHRELVKQGFWLSNILIGGAIRMRRSTADKIGDRFSELVTKSQRTSPVYCEARYLRDPEWLEKCGAGKERFLLLWVFAMIDEQYGFALDIADIYVKLFGLDEWASFIMEEPILSLRANQSPEIQTNVLNKKGFCKIARILGYLEK